VRIETKPLQPADTDNSDDDTPTYLEAGTQRSVGIHFSRVTSAIRSVSFLRVTSA
jgi:hypothetical protein